MEVENGSAPLQQHVEERSNVETDEQGLTAEQIHELVGEVSIDEVVEPIVECICGHRAVLMISRCERHPGRKYWVCSEGSPVCNYFKWHDEWLAERYVAVVNELRELNSHLKGLVENNVKQESVLAGVLEELHSMRQDITSLQQGLNEAREFGHCMRWKMDLYRAGLFIVVGVLLLNTFHG